MKEKVTSVSPSYPAGQEPNFIIPKEYGPFRYALGKDNSNPLVAICMNPSAAREESSDRTINRVIGFSQKLGKDGWMVFNIYPERATDASMLDEFDKKVSDENIKVICDYLEKRNISEVWGAWGNDGGIETLSLAREELKKALQEIGVKVFCFGSLTKAGNPRHPLYMSYKLIEHKEYL